MKEIIESYFQQRSLVNHQLASYNDCIPSTDGKVSRMEKIVRNIRIGTDEVIEDDDGGIIKLDVLDHEALVPVARLHEFEEALVTEAARPEDLGRLH